MFARVYARHLDPGVKEREIFQRDGFVGVVAHDVFHHKGRGEGLRGERAGEVETRGAVVRGVGYVEGVGADGTGIANRVSARIFLGGLR